MFPKAHKSKLHLVELGQFMAARNEEFMTGSSWPSMPARWLVIDAKDWDRAVSKVTLSESGLIAILNARLKAHPKLSCQIVSLRPRVRREQNWAVAEFSLGHCEDMDEDTRYASIAEIVVATADDFDVDWPSPLLH